MSHASSTRLSVLHTLRLRGVAAADAIAAKMRLDADAVDDELAALVALDLVEERFGARGGFALSEPGRDTAADLIDHELTTTGVRSVIEDEYQRFLGFNRTLLTVCTQWQLRPDATGELQHNDHTDAAHDAAVIDALADVHDQVMSVIDSLTAELARFGGYRRSLQTALDAVRAGDHDYFTKPLFPSYHSIWFEFHEDLLVTLGRTRATERSS